MIRKLLRLVLFQLVFTHCCFAQKKTNDYIEKFLPLAKDLSAEYGIPVSIILGVSIHESASGTSPNCRDLNNYFGVKGKNHLKKRKTKYKQYKTAEDSFKDFCGILSRKKYYETLKDNMNYRLWLTEMNKAEYAGAKNKWIFAIKNDIRAYKLSAYDDE